MSTVVFVKEQKNNESRCSCLPQNISSFVKRGMKVCVESGIGETIHISDAEYAAVGARVVIDRRELLKDADFILSIHPLSKDELEFSKPSACCISFLDPFNAREHISWLQNSGRSALSMELIPRSSRCQKMDALSSQASLAGYVMVAQAMLALPKVFPMMMTPSGTIKPTKVFVIGAGVAGLQAIATAKRLGASVIAYDTRETVAEQVRSLGAKFLDIDLGETGQNEQGYANALSQEQIELQLQAQADCIKDADVVITTAQLFGRKPPVLIKKDVIREMKAGSVIVDMAVESGGNVEGSISGENVVYEGVTLIGKGNWSSDVAYHASQMYANNLQALLFEFWNDEEKRPVLDLNDEILQTALITHQNQFINPSIKALFSQEIN
ncbi:NAD(P) transhydrogenase subunit alpha [Aliiglaciecola sp. 3_MG-2023]|uniref:NAD(P) transhydrogenase subunit alpha n=1 Tax=Aliiglaciecola sp. 3_MG-2023 TaxID=3062644 RepID=UPI0026E3B986|nr:NAD(P) transhydrogenase subunit alpha [Aliiglaciecola sp. 3_MG-2023]MDO6693322.1 NAD(P) transhydrogenase subunit alpha [Aliiglaciecola sp. 3_MG-2023]